MDFRTTHHPARCGFTLVEMTVVILVLVSMIAAGFYGTNAYRSWSLAREASENLRTAYVAQRTFLADNPTTPVATLTQQMLLPYVPGNPSSFPSGKSLNGAALTVRVNVSPPFMTTSAGGTSGERYDPSANTSDALWDVGE